MDFHIWYHFMLGIKGLLPRDLHWLLELTKVFKYDFNVKAQWLASIELAQEQFAVQNELGAAAMQTQRDLMVQWLVGPTTESAAGE